MPACLPVHSSRCPPAHMAPWLLCCLRVLSAPHPPSPSLPVCPRVSLPACTLDCPVIAAIYCQAPVWADPLLAALCPVRYSVCYVPPILPVVPLCLPPSLPATLPNSLPPSLPVQLDCPVIAASHCQAPVWADLLLVGLAACLPPFLPIRLPPSLPVLPPCLSLRLPPCLPPCMSLCRPAALPQSN